MKRLAFFLLAVCVSAFSQSAVSDNWESQWWDIDENNFRSDSIKYTPWFNLTDYENLNIGLLFDDTTAAGFSSDSVKFIAEIQFARIFWRGYRTRDTAIDLNVLILDTIDMLTAAKKVRTYSYIGTDGTYTEAAGLIDTINVTGYAAYNRTITPPWKTHARIRIRGVTGNRTVGLIKLYAFVDQRKYTIAR